MPANVESMFSVRGKPWHLEGIILGDYPGTWAEARVLAGLDWDPVTAEVYSVTGISADGGVIVGYDRPFGPALGGLGFISFNGAPMVDLTAYAMQAGINLNGFTLALPTAVSADGRTVVGIGYAGNTVQDFVLQLPLTSVPEPSPFALAAVLASLVGLRAAWRRVGGARR